LLRAAVQVEVSVGVTLAVRVGLGLVAGQWLDGQVHSGLVFTLLGVLAGLTVGVSSVVALCRTILRTSEREWRRA
jgi:hypothetical protein